MLKPIATPANDNIQWSSRHFGEMVVMDIASGSRCHLALLGWWGGHPCAVSVAAVGVVDDGTGGP